MHFFIEFPLEKRPEPRPYFPVSCWYWIIPVSPLWSRAAVMFWLADCCPGASTLLSSTISTPAIVTAEFALQIFFCSSEFSRGNKSFRKQFVEMTNVTNLSYQPHNSTFICTEWLRNSHQLTHPPQPIVSAAEIGIWYYIANSHCW